MATAEKTKLSGIATGAEVNQNAFSNIVVGSTTIAADTKTDSLTLAGSNVTLTPDSTNDKVTIGITKENVVAALGYTPPTADTNTHYTSKNVVGSSTATSNTTSALTNGNVYLNSVENGAVTSTHKISGSGATTVTTDASGNIVISSTDTNTNTVTTVSTTGSGNAITSLSASNGAITATKGSTFLTAHPTISTSTDTTSTATATHGGTVTMVDSITRDSNGHVTQVNTKTVTLPSDNNTDTKVTQTVTTTNASYPLLLAPSGQTTTTTTTSYFDSGVTLNPSTNTIAANISGSSAKLGSSTLGSETSPIYLNSGTATACSTYAGGTAVTLNGTSKAASTASFYAPTTAGTSGYVLTSNGSGAPTWSVQTGMTTTVVTTASTDLNNYTTTGIYYFSSSYTPTNIPAGVNGWLIVYTGNSSSYVKQIWYRHGTANSNDHQSWVRTNTGGTWSDWHMQITATGGTMTGTLCFANGSTYYVDSNGNGSLKTLETSGVIKSGDSVRIPNGSYFQSYDTNGDARNCICITSDNQYDIATGGFANTIRLGTSNSTKTTIYGTAITLTGNTSTTGHIYIPNVKGIYCKNSSGSNIQAVYMNASNELLLGNGVSTILKVGNASNTTRTQIFSAGRIDFLASGVSSTDGNAITFVDTNFRPTTDSKINLGGTSYRWLCLYATAGVSASSDMRLKENITDLDNRHILLWDKLTPKTYNMIKYERDRKQLGYIAQEVEDAAFKVGLNLQDCGFIHKDWVEREDYTGYEYSLNYDGLAVLTTAKVKQQEERIKELEDKISSLKEKITSILEN